MKKNIAIAALSVALTVVAVCLYQTRKENRSLRLELQNAEINLHFDTSFIN